MRRNRVTSTRLLGGIGLCLWLAAAPTLAHHPVLAKFDDKRPVRLTGVVTKVDWANPHVHVFVNVRDGDDGAPTNWVIELESPVELEWSGWTEDTLEAGDHVTVEGIAARNGSDQAWANVVTVGGKHVLAVADDVFAAQLGGGPNGAVPRWPDGQPKLGPPEGRYGYWAMPSASSLVEDGVAVEMDAYGVLKNIEDAPKVAPFQTWARDLYVLRQSTYLKDDPMFLYCMPPGGPRQFQSPYGVLLAEQRDRERIFVLMAGGNRNWRLIYTDGRPQVGSIAGDDNNPLFFGRSVGKWEGDTLVVDTKGFNEAFWFSNGGLPHTSQLHLVERFTRLDLNTLQYEVTVDDGGAYTRPWTSSWTLKWVIDKELPEYFCQDNRP